MKLYHGTNIDFDEIDLQKSKPNKDFGQALICLPIFIKQVNWQMRE